MSALSISELEDLRQAVSERLEDGLLPALALANRTGELGDLLRLLGMSDLLGDDGQAEVRPTRILVLGQSMTSEGKLRSIAKRHGFQGKDFEFVLEYEALKHFNFDKLRNSMTYRAVLAGPMPHSTPGKRDASSTVAMMEAHPETYPPVIRLTDANGLKITNNSFAVALDAIQNR
ncbi:MAG: hypothetical protein SOI46_02295 [Eggerthellaceae bacterium]